VITLDGDLEAEGKDYFRLAGTGQSPDHGSMIWGYDDKGSEFFTLKVRDFRTGGILTISSRTPAVAAPGAPMARASSIQQLMTITGQAGSTTTGSAPRRRKTD
jgi:hypothetical protein